VRVAGRQQTPVRCLLADPDRSYYSRTAGWSAEGGPSFESDFEVLIVIVVVMARRAVAHLPAPACRAELIELNR
jgi:hypothetical protein